jgi:IS30 family transposase
MEKHYEHLTAEERAAIMMMKASHIAHTLHRAPSTITRELARFAAWPDRPTLVADAPTEYDTRAAGMSARPRGELRKDLIACLRRAQRKRMPRSRGEDRRGQMPDLLSIHVRPHYAMRWPSPLEQPSTGKWP